MVLRADVSQIVEMAARQDQIVARRDLLGRGVGRKAIDRIISTGMLAVAFDGIYVVGGTALTQRQLLRCALLYSGPESGLSGYSAAEGRDLLNQRIGWATVSTARTNMERQRRARLPMADGRPGFITIRPTKRPEFQTWSGLPGVSVPRMLIEVAASHGADVAERAWRSADFRRMLDLDEVRAELARTRRRGSPVVRELLATMPAPVDPSIDIRSPAEIDFLALVASAGLPTPEVNVPMVVGGAPFVADFFYRDLGLVVEVDDPSHRRPVAMGRDKIRDLDFFIAGLDVVRFETHVLARKPARSMAKLAAAIDRQRRRVPRRAA